MPTHLQPGGAAVSPSEDHDLRRRSRFLYAGLALVVSVGTLLLVVAVRHSDQAASEEDRLWRPGQVATRDLVSFAVDEETGQRGYLLTGDARFLDPYTVGRTGSDAQVDLLHDLFDDHEPFASMVAQVDRDLQAWREQAAEPEIAAVEESPELARAMVASGTGKELFDTFRRDAEQLVAGIDEASASAAARRSDALRTVVVTAAAALAALLASAVMVLVLSRRWIAQIRAGRQRLRSTVDVLQQGLLPERLPDVDGVTLASAYLAASDDLEVGGDFYDVSLRPDGVLAMTIGDVAGHDVRSAVLTAAVRHTIRAAAGHLDDPAEVLRWANDAVQRYSTDGLFVTVAHAHLHLDTRTLHLVLAGHPQPVLLPAAGGAATMIGELGTILGVLHEPRLTTATVQLADGDQIVMFTDGLAENSRPRLGADELLSLITASRGDDAATTCSNVLDRYQRHPLGESRDDVALIVVQLVGPPTATSDQADARSSHPIGSDLEPQV